jgi:hypothetical protein
MVVVKLGDGVVLSFSDVTEREHLQASRPAVPTRCIFVPAWLFSLEAFVARRSLKK